MKILFFLFLKNVFAWQASFFVDAGATSIPATFDLTSSSLVLSSLRFPRVLTICNETSSRVCVNNQTSSGSAPSLITHRVPAGQCLSTAWRFGARVFISGCGTTISSGVVHGYVD